MSLADLASLGSFISGVAVLVSLIYVGVQVRQAKLHQQAAIRQGRADRIVSMCFAAGDPSGADRIVTMCFHGGDPFIADACAKGYAGAEDITESQLTQYHYICRGFFYHCEEEFFQHKEGLANDAYYASFVSGTTKMFCQPGLRVQWKLQRESFVPEFVRFMDGLMAQSKLSTHSDPLAQWKAAVAAEKAGR